MTIQRPRSAVLPSKHVSKPVWICQPPGGRTAVSANEGLSEVRLPPAPSAAGKAHPPCGVPRLSYVWGAPCGCGWMEGVACASSVRPLASRTQEALASRFLTAPGDGALFQGPQGVRRGCVCLLYLPSISDPPLPLIPPLSGSNQRLSYVPSCPFSKGFTLPADAAGSSSVTHLPLGPVKGLETAGSLPLLVPVPREFVLSQLRVYSHTWLSPVCHCFQSSPPSVFCFRRLGLIPPAPRGWWLLLSLWDPGEWKGRK